MGLRLLLGACVSNAISGINSIDTIRIIESVMVVLDIVQVGEINLESKLSHMLHVDQENPNINVDLYQKRVVR